MNTNATKNGRKNYFNLYHDDLLKAVSRSCATLIFLLPFVATADCLPEGSTKSDDIICTGTDNDGVVSGNGDDSVTVSSGANISVKNTEPVISLTAVDTGNQDDSVINYGEVSVTLAVDATSSIDLGLDKLNTWTNLSAIGVNVGNGGDYIANHGLLSVDAILNPSSLLQVSNIEPDSNSQPVFIQVNAIGMIGDEGSDELVNTGELRVTAKDNTGTNAAKAVGIKSGNGKDIITNSGTITVTASSKQPSLLSQTVTTLAKDKTTYTSKPASKVTATGIDAGNAKDAVITNSGVLVVNSFADWPVSQVVSQGIQTGNGKDVIFNDGEIKVDSSTVVSERTTTASLNGGDDLTATTTLDSFASGIDSGNAKDTITNDGTILSQTLSELTNVNVELNLVDTSHADSSTSLFSNSVAITSGNGQDTVTNTGAIKASATSRLDTLNVEINGADAGLADSINLLDSSANAMFTGSGNDTIATSGSVTASATSEMDEVSVNVSYLDITIADREGSDTSTRLYSSATSIDSGSGNDNLYIDTTGQVDAIALSDVHSIGVSIVSEGVPASTESLFINGSLADVSLESFSDTTAIIIGQGNDELVSLGNVTSQATANSSQLGVNIGIALIDFVVPTPGIVLGGGGTASKAESVGFDLGQGNDVVNNAGLLDVDAITLADSTIVSVNLAELSFSFIDAVPSLGGAVVAADTTTSASSTAFGINAGEGNDVIDNSGTLAVNANAHGSSTSAAAGLGIQIGENDNALQIDAILARAETQSSAYASGITGDKGHDHITNSGTIVIGSVAETDALGIGIDIAGTVQASGGAIGATLTDTSSTSTAYTIGIDGGNSHDTIVNSGRIDVDAKADTSNINVSVTVGFVKNGLVAGAALAKAETTGIATAVGINGGEGKDNIINDGELDVKAISDVDSVAVSVTVGGTAKGLAAGAALADGGATAIANATGIRSSEDNPDNCSDEHQTLNACSAANKSDSDPDPSISDDKHNKDFAEIVNNNSIIVDAKANTYTTSIAADVQIAKEGAAIGAALADNSAFADATSIGIDADSLDNVLLNNGDILLKSNAFAQAVSIGVSVQGTSSGLAAGAALTNASVTSNASAFGILSGAGDDVLLNTGTIHTGSEAEKQVQSTATAFGVSLSTLVSKEGAALGAALADTDATASTYLTAIDGQQGDDELINQGTIDLQNVAANADAVSVAVSVAVSQSGVAGGAAVANSDSTAELTANGMVGADGEDTLVNENTVSLKNMNADADAVSVSLTVTGTEAGVALSGALVNAEATATANASGLSGGEHNDYLYNLGSIIVDTIIADTDAVGVGVGFSFSGQGVAVSAALAKSGATSNVIVKGLDGGSADDKLINEGTITLNNIEAESDAVSVSVGLSGTTAGVSVSAALTDASGHANATVTGMDGGSGNDYLFSNNTITISDVDTDAHATGVSVTAQVSAAGVAGGFSLADTSATSSTLVTGMHGGDGNDTVSNQGDIDLQGKATAGALSIALNISASVGLGGGAAITDASTTAQSNVMGIDGGEGFDDIFNDGNINVTANSDAESTAASVGITVAVGGDVTLADARSTSNATAIGIYDAEGVTPKEDKQKDAKPLSILTNLGVITATATAESEGLAISGNLLGYALGETTNVSTADSAGIRYDQGADLIYNEGYISANSVATAKGLSVAVSLGGAAVGDTSTTASAYANGIESGDGNDEIVNFSAQEGAAINVDARSFASGESITVGLIGVQKAETTNTANATAKGIDAGEGNDVVLNDAVMNISAGNPLVADGTGNCTEGGSGACAESFAVSATLAGYGSVDASSIANASALGITSGEGDDVVQSNKAITVTSLARSKAEGISVTLFGANDVAANTTANASATGLLGDAGHDKLINASNLSVQTGAETWAKSLSITIAGEASASADTTTTASAVGIDGGADNDIIVNTETGYIDVYAKTQSEANASSWNFAGNALAAATLGALTDSYGILGGSGDDWIENAGGIKVETFSDLNAFGTGNNIFGNAGAGTQITATASATGIDSGDDNDVIKNIAVIDVDSTGDMYSRATSFSLIGGASTDELITAGSHSIGISSGAGNDEVFNWGQISVDAESLLKAEGGSSVAIGGDARSVATIAANTTGEGISTGIGDDILTSFEASAVEVIVRVDANSDTESSAGIYFSDGVIKSTAVSSSLAYGFNVDEGNNIVLNEGDISVALLGITRAKGVATADDVSNYLGLDVDAYATTVSQLNENKAYGIAAGDGNNQIMNLGTIDVGSWSEAETYAFANGQAIASGDGTAHATGHADNAYTSGIETGDGNNYIYNSGSIIINNYVSSDVDTDSDADGIGEFREPDSKSTSVASANSVIAVGIRSGQGENKIYNEGQVSVTATPTADADADADHGGDIIGIDTEAKTFVSADGVKALGIWAGDSDNWIWNKLGGSIIVTSAPHAVADSFANGVGWDGDAGVRADAHANNAFSVGIQTGNGFDSIQNDGEINVTAAPLAETRAVSSRGCDLLHLNCGENEFGDNTTPGQWSDVKDALAIGIRSNSGDDLITNTGMIISTMHATAIVDGTLRHLASSGTAMGIDGGEGDNLISNEGAIFTTALTNSDDVITGLVDSDADSITRGISVGDGKNEMTNSGELKAYATAMASLEEEFEIPLLGLTFILPGGEADSIATGMYAGNGGNLIINNGVIDVVATARGDSSMVSATAYGIKTGDGNDTIINNGTINTSTVLETGISLDALVSTESLGIAITSGGGDDTIMLGDGSVTNGDIDLGTGSDTLSLEGTPVINGDIIDEMSSVSLSFNNNGCFDGSLPGVTAVKNGEGTFTLSMLNQMDYLEVNKGTLQLNNDYIFHENGKFQATVSGDGSYGQFLVNGTTSLNGQLKVVRGNGAYLDGTTYEVLRAVNGIEKDTAFSAIELPEDKPLLTFQLNQSENTVQVETDVKSFTTVARSSNEMAVAKHWDNILPTVNGDLNFALGDIQTLSSGKEFASALYSLSPAAYNNFTLASITSMQQYTYTLNSRMSNLHFSEFADPTRNLQKEPVMLAANGSLPQGLFIRDDYNYRYGIFVRGFGQHGAQDSTGDNYGYDFTLNGIILGFDHKFSSNYVAGVSVGLANNDLAADEDSSTGDIDSTLYSVYGSYLLNNGYIDAVLSYGKNSYDTQRNVIIGATTTDVTSAHDGDLLSLGLSGGAYSSLGNWWLRPYVSLQYTRLDEDGFTESGGGSSLNVAARTTNALISQLGTTFLRDYNVNSGHITPELTIAWNHDFDIDGHLINASYVGAPDASFSIEGQKVEKDGLVLGAGFSYETSSGYITTVKVNSEFRKNYNVNTIIGEFRYQF